MRVKEKYAPFLVHRLVKGRFQPGGVRPGGRAGHAPPPAHPPRGGGLVSGQARLVDWGRRGGEVHMINPYFAPMRMWKNFDHIPDGFFPDF
jgi:hypothetical protein